MKKIFLLFMVVSLVASYVHAADVGKLDTDDKGMVVQGAAPNGKRTVALTGNSYTTDGKDVWLMPISTTAYKIRWMPAANSTKANYVQTTIPAEERFNWVRNKATPFANISGATGTLIRQ